MELADLISLSAQLHARGDEQGRLAAEALWLAAVVAVAAGPDERHERAKELLRDDQAETGALELVEAGAELARRSGIADAWEQTTEQVGFAIPERG
jgi:hypothetical protein